MSKILCQVDSEIRTDADGILRSGLRTILDRHGDVHIVGSYALGLMTWRDLDIHVVREDLDVSAFFDLGRVVGSAAFGPSRQQGIRE